MAQSRIVRFLILPAVAIGAAALATWGLGLYWRLIGGGAMSLHGWIAMALGIAGTLGLTWGLTTLAFKSHREGWDDRVDNSLDPARKTEDDD